MGSFLNGHTSLSSIFTSPSSINRLAILFIAGLVIITFIILALIEMRALFGGNSTIHSLLNRPHILISSIGLAFTGLASVYLFGHVIFRLFELQDVFPSWQLLFIWGAFALLQLIGLTTLLRGTGYWRDAWAELKNRPGWQWLIKRLTPSNMGFALLATSFLIGLTKVYFGRFVDEAEVITFGWLISQGDVLYRDIFSHHFPLPYYWAAMVVNIFGNSFAAVRISVLLLQVGLFAVSMRITKYYLAIATTSVAWNLINQFHRGQEAIYATFEGIFISVALFLILWILVKSPKVSAGILVLIGSLLGLALLTDPLMIYPISVALLGLLVSGLNYPKGKRWRVGLRHLILAVLFVAVVIGVYGLYLFYSDTISEFYREAIWFNSEIYSKYVDANPNRLSAIQHNLFSGINILDSRWMRELSPFLPMEAYRSVKLENENLYSSWIFASFLFRLSILACSLGLVLNRKIAAGIFLYVYSGTLLVREDDGLYAIAFTLVSLFAAFYLLFELRKPSYLYETRQSHTNKGTTLLRMSSVGWVSLLILIGGMQAWSAVRGGYFIVNNPRAFANSNHVWQYLKFGKDIRQLGCNQEGLELGVYPINPIVHFVTGIPPVSKYVWMYPWVAEIGQDELIAELRDHPSAIMWIRVERGAGAPDGVAAYMKDTIDFLNNEYRIVLKDAIWMSPELAEKCPLIPGETPFLQNVDD